MPIDKIELTKEQVAKAMACKTAEELMAMAKAEGKPRRIWRSWKTSSLTRLRCPKWRAAVWPIARTSLNLKRRLSLVTA